MKWRVWIYDEVHEIDVEITPFLRTGNERLTIADGRVVFSQTGHPWTPAPCPFSLSPRWLARGGKSHL